MFGSDYVPSEVPTLIDIGVVRPKGQGMETTCQKPKKIIWTQYKCGLLIMDKGWMDDPNFSKRYVEECKEFEKNHQRFLEEPCNIRIGLAIDGFNPFGNMSTSYSMWPVIRVPYNLSPSKPVIDDPIYNINKIVIDLRVTIRNLGTTNNNNSFPTTTSTTNSLTVEDNIFVEQDSKEESNSILHSSYQLLPTITMFPMVTQCLQAISSAADGVSTQLGDTPSISTATSSSLPHKQKRKFSTAPKPFPSWPLITYHRRE
uniref:Uncharacterized protein n=1 Tax=Solanum lycopersicum TaxID=4081 RepID=A0A3Q7GDP1_SOLLC